MATRGTVDMRFDLARELMDGETKGIRMLQMREWTRRSRCNPRRSHASLACSVLDVPRPRVSPRCLEEPIPTAAWVEDGNDGGRARIGGQEPQLMFDAGEAARRDEKRVMQQIEEHRCLSERHERPRRSRRAHGR